MTIFGYFDAPGQNQPAFDPGLEVPCPFCLSPLHNGPRRTISLMAMGNRERSYFYRAHRQCHDGASEGDIEQVESSLIDSTAQRRGGDSA